MRFQGLNRTRKVKLLSRFFQDGNKQALLVQLSQHRDPNYETWSDEELTAELERLRQAEYRETGVLPPAYARF